MPRPEGPCVPAQFCKTLSKLCTSPSQNLYKIQWMDMDFGAKNTTWVEYEASQRINSYSPAILKTCVRNIFCQINFHLCLFLAPTGPKCPGYFCFWRALPCLLPPKFVFCPAPLRKPTPTSLKSHLFSKLCNLVKKKLCWIHLSSSSRACMSLVRQLSILTTCIL